MRNMYSSIPTKDGLHEAKPREVINDPGNRGLILFTFADGTTRAWQIGTNIKSVRMADVRKVEAQGSSYVALVRSNFTNIILPTMLARNFVWTGQQAQMIGANWGYWL